ncbi:MAG: endonuclease/exonuclease/phosphatase family protein [Gammaproteobacteria bacterium]|nr:endonuclease/exonuclease/phosphatase family protein [Gammaproteobacteria bacterium]
MKIASWSVNGVNRRLQYLQHWLRKRQPDIVALQKIRVSGKHRGNFPRKAIEEVGYRVEELLVDHELASVAVLVRQDFLQTNGHRELKVRQRGLAGREADGRLLAVDAGRAQVASIYAPFAPCGYGTRDQVRRSIETKADWLRRLKQWADQWDARKPILLCGDFNVTLDGGSEPDTLNRSPEEREAMNSLLASGFADLYRDFHGEGEPGFNSGIPITRPADTRLHLVLGPPSVVPHIKSAWVDLEYRGPINDLPGEKWAPGAPVIVEVDGDVALTH